MIIAYDGAKFLNIDDILYSLEKVQEHRSSSRMFDAEEKAPAKKKPYIPPLDHPWRRFTYESTRRRNER